MKQKKKILVVDDDASIVEVTKIILEEHGYEVFTGQNEQDLHRLLAQQEPDLVLMDVWLAQADGNVITKELKKEKKTKNIPIILFSALNEIETITQQAGADGFLRKPYDIDDLLRTIEQHTKHK